VKILTITNNSEKRLQYFISLNFSYYSANFTAIQCQANDMTLCSPYLIANSLC